MPGAAGEGGAGDGDAAGLGSDPLPLHLRSRAHGPGVLGESREGCQPVDSVKRVLVPLGRFGNTNGQTKWVKWSKPQEIHGEGAGGGAT